MKLIPIDSVDLEDPYTAKEFEWLLQWGYLYCGDEDDFLELSDLRIERDQLSEQLKDEMEDKLELQKAIEKVTYDFQFATLLKEQLAIERDSLLLRLEELNAKNLSDVARLNAQIGSMQVIISESEQKICQQEQLRRQLLNSLNAQEQEHLQELRALKQNLENKNLDSVSCSICLEVWNESGPHRVVSLACGHLFGDSCIRNYLSPNRQCPICRQVANIGDLRYIFSHRILPNQV